MMGVRRKQCLHSCTEITITNFLAWNWSSGKAPLMRSTLPLLLSQRVSLRPLYLTRIPYGKSK